MQTRQQTTRKTNDYKSLIASYIAGFSKHYPNVLLEVKQGRDHRTKEVNFRVMIDDSDGNRPLSVRDMQEAVLDFAR